MLRLCVGIDLAVIAFALGHGLHHTGNPSRYFGEGRYTTGVSCFQLLVVAGLTFATWRKRQQAANDGAGGRWIWALIGSGFIFLACDDAFKIHEHLDKWIRYAFHLPLNAFTDRIDDAIIGVYGLAGLAALWITRREWLRFEDMFRPLMAGFVLLALNVTCDALSNRPDVFRAATGSVPLSKKIESWFAVGDGAFQLLAEGLFIAAFYGAWFAARRGAGNNESRL